MIPLAEVEQRIAAAVQETEARLHATIARLERIVMESKQVIARMRTQLYGVRAETSQVVLTAEGQEVIDETWLASRDATPPPPPVVEVEGTTVRRPRDRRGMAQRHPHLPIQEVDAAIPAELQEQVASGALIARRCGRHHDELLTPLRPEVVIRRVHELELVRAATGAVVMQIAPDRIVPLGDLADETIHGFIQGKFADALPFHRQLERLARARVVIPKQTVNDAVNAWGDLFAPLAQTILAQVLASPVVHADASWMRVQAAERCDRVHLWTTLGGGQVAFQVTEDLTHERGRAVLGGGIGGKLAVDAWPGWFAAHPAERLFLCIAHARRPFADWLKRDPSSTDAQRMVVLIRDLYRLEHQAEDGPPDQLLERRRRIRNERSRPIMAQIRQEAARIAAAYPGRHQLAEGARYIVTHWDGLSRCLDHPDVPLDNNAAENALRINALIRKNSLFAGSLDASHRDAVALTVVHSCRLQRLDLSDYLQQVTPVLLLHRRGRKQDLAAITPAAVAARRRG